MRIYEANECVAPREGAYKFKTQTAQQEDRPTRARKDAAFPRWSQETTQSRQIKLAFFVAFSFLLWVVFSCVFTPSKVV